MHGVERQRQPARRLLARVTGKAREHECGRSDRERASDRKQLRDRPLRPLGAVDVDRRSGRHGEQEQHELEVEVVPPEVRGASDRNHRAEIERRAQRELRGGDHDIDRDRDQRDAERYGQRDGERSQGCAAHSARNRTRDQEA